MTAALIWSVIVLGVGNVAQVAERWHLVNRATELADRIVGMHGDRVRVVAPPKAPAQDAQQSAQQSAAVEPITAARRTG